MSNVVENMSPIVFKDHLVHIIDNQPYTEALGFDVAGLTMRLSAGTMDEVAMKRLRHRLATSLVSLYRAGRIGRIRNERNSSSDHSRYFYRPLSATAQAS